MPELKAAQVMALRKKTGLPMMECKEALMANDADESAAIEWLKKKHKGKMESRSDRETGEGRIGVYISADGKTGGIVELRCETAPVGKNDLFIDLANSLAEKVANGADEEPDPTTIQAGSEKAITDVYGQLRETINVGRCRKLSGDALAFYVHHDGKSGVLTALKGNPADDELGKNLSIHITFHQPLAITRDGVPGDEVEKVRSEAVAMAKEDGKPEQIVEKIADGKVEAFFAEKVLLEQEHVRNDVYGKKKVKDILNEHGVETVIDYAFLAVGG